MVLLQTITPWRVRRLGIVMEPDPTDAREVEGVLNPAAVRGPDGHLYLLPRVVATGNYSRIGLARVLVNRAGRPIGVERQGIILEPQAPYECNPWSGGGVEDPRVTYVAARQLYVMTYTALGPAGPRIAAAVSRDLRHWRRLGLVRFTTHEGRDMGAPDNKDALLFPEPVLAPDGRVALALIHRPTFRAEHLPPSVQDARPSMWLSYAPLDDVRATRHIVFSQHHHLAGPERGWEQLKVGGGTPPVRLGPHWLVLYHGVAYQKHGGTQQPSLCYSGGILLLDGQRPAQVVYRSARSLLAPRVGAEKEGLVPQVVFPTGLDARPDGTWDVYYGMADSRIGVARVTATDLLAGGGALVA